MMAPRPGVGRPSRLRGHNQGRSVARAVAYQSSRPKNAKKRPPPGGKRGRLVGRGVRAVPEQRPLANMYPESYSETTLLQSSSPTSFTAPARRQTLRRGFALAAPDTRLKGAGRLWAGVRLLPSGLLLDRLMVPEANLRGGAAVWGVACGMNFSSSLSSCRAS